MTCVKWCPACGRALDVAEFNRNKSRKDGLGDWCRGCNARYKAEYRQRDPVRLKALKKASYERNRETDNNRCHDWYSRNREYWTAHVRQYNQDNAVIVASRKRERRAANPEKYKDQHARAWHRRRARQAAVLCDVVRKDAIFERDHWRCRLCGCKTPKELQGSILPTAPTLDHIIPLALGGPHTAKNLQCLCHRCNSRKKDKYTGQLAFA